MRAHYPRTPHLPWSPGVTPDDVRAVDLTGLTGREVVVTEKLDGENTTLYPDGLHARSLDSAHHPSRAWVKALHGRIAALIPAGWRVCGENVYARHSIAYTGLESWFYAFSVWSGDQCLDWDATGRFTRRLGVPVPPVLWRGVFDERTLRALRPDTAGREGYVVRTVDGFDRAEFGRRVAKWVRRDHVRTDRHWMLGPVVPNGLGPAAPLWDVRSGGTPEAGTLLTALGDEDAAGRVDARTSAVLADGYARLDLIDRRGDARLAGALAALLHRARRPRLAARLVTPLGLPLARRVADLVGLHSLLHRPYPDADRRSGLVRLAAAADLGVLHAVAAAVLAGRDEAGPAADDPANGPDPADDDPVDFTDPVDAAAQVEWSALHADDAGLLGESPLTPFRTGLRRLLDDAGTVPDPDAADRCWAEAVDAYARGNVGTAEEAVAATWRWRSGNFPRLLVTVGPSGSGKSRFVAGLDGVDTVVSLDDLRQDRGSRSDQRDNASVLRDGLDRLDRALAAGGTVAWDATAINRRQRGLVRAVAERRNALTTYAVLLVPDDLLATRNARRAHPVPERALAAQLRRWCPPYPGEAHRTWYVGADGRVGDVAGTLCGEED